MARYFIQDETLTNLADKIRVLNGTEENMTPSQMDSELGDANDEVDTQSTLIDQLSEMLEGKAVGGDGEQATPVISVSSDGLITATAGTKSATEQLTVQAAKTITPSTSSQTAVASGVYTTGVVTVDAIPSSYVKPTATKAATTYIPTTTNQTIASGTYLSGTQTIKGDSNLVAENIKKGVSIFDVDGSYESSGIQYEIVTIPAGSNSVAYTLPRVTHAFGSASLFLETVNSIRPYNNSVVSIRNNSAYYIYNLDCDTVREWIEVEFYTSAVTYSNGILTIDIQNGIMFDVQVLLVNDPTASQISLPS